MFTCIGYFHNRTVLYTTRNASTLSARNGGGSPVKIRLFWGGPWPEKVENHCSTPLAYLVEHVLCRGGVALGQGGSFLDYVISSCVLLEQWFSTFSGHDPQNNHNLTGDPPP